MTISVQETFDQAYRHVRVCESALASQVAIARFTPVSGSRRFK